MPFDIEETLKAGDLPSDVLPHMLWNEMILGTEKRRVFRDLTQVTDALRGQVGTKISVPILSTRFTAGTISESTLDSTGYTFSDPAVTDTDITIGNQVYVAFKISDILKEDQPKFNWIRILLQDAGRAIAEYEDGAIRDVYLAGAGNSMSAATAGTLAYDDLLSCLALMKIDSWWPGQGVTPVLVLHPNQETDLLKDTRYVNSHRYSVADVGMLASADDLARGEVESIYADCNVKVSDNMINALALIIFPSPHPRYGPVAIHAMKRPLTIRTEREETYGRQLWVASMRYGTSVIQANAVGLISNC